MTETQPKHTFLNRLAKSLAAMGIGILVGLVLLEIIARAFHLGSGGFWEPYSLYGWRNIPGAKGWESCYGECAVRVEINSLGLRDAEIPYEKPAGAQRIFFLGDSITAGMQVPLEDTFEKILERNLASNGNWQVLNGGVNGFGTDNELLFYRLEGVKYEPDIVVLSIYLANDIYNNHRQLEVSLSGSEHKPYFTLEENGELELHNFPVESADAFSVKVGTFLKRYFQLPRFVAEALNLRRNVPEALRPLVELVGGQRGGAADNGTNGTEEKRGPRADICNPNYVPVIQEAWDITKALILQLQSEVEASGAELVVVAIPAKPQLDVPIEGKDWYCTQPNIELDGFLEEEGISYFDLLESFRQHSLEGGEPLYYTRDFHLNETGHALAGELLSEFFADYLHGLK